MSSDLTEINRRWDSSGRKRGSFYVTDSTKRDTENELHFTPLLLQVSCLHSTHILTSYLIIGFFFNLSFIISFKMFYGLFDDDPSLASSPFSPSQKTRSFIKANWQVYTSRYLNAQVTLLFWISFFFSCLAENKTKKKKKKRLNLVGLNKGKNVVKEGRFLLFWSRVGAASKDRVGNDWKCLRAFGPYWFHIRCSGAHG